MMASEYRLAGSNQVVFLVKDCQMMPGPGPSGMRVVPGNKIDPNNGPAQFEPGRVMDGGMMHDGPHDGAMDHDGGDGMGGARLPDLRRRTFRHVVLSVWWWMANRR